MTDSQDSLDRDSTSLARQPGPGAPSVPAQGASVSPGVSSAVRQDSSNLPCGEDPLDLTDLVARHQMGLICYARRLLGQLPVDESHPRSPDSLARDLTQEAFLRLHRQCRQQGSASVRHPSTWLYRVVHNQVMDVIRQWSRQRRHAQGVEDIARQRQDSASESAADALDELEKREAIGLAMRLLGDLPDEQQRIITLKLLEGLTLRQIAEVIGSTPGSVNYHLNQGLARLASQLKQKGVV